MLQCLYVERFNGPPEADLRRRLSALLNAGCAPVAIVMSPLAADEWQREGDDLGTVFPVNSDSGLPSYAPPADERYHVEGHTIPVYRASASGLIPA